MSLSLTSKAGSRYVSLPSGHKHSSGKRQPLHPGRCPGKDRRGGFSLIELVLGVTILAVGLLGLATMFSTGYTDVTAGARLTMAGAAARQIFEEMHALPFDRLTNLNNFTTSNPGSLPANDPERTVARRWRYALAGGGAGWGISGAEAAQWTMLSTTLEAFGAGGEVSVVFGARGRLNVANDGTSRRIVTVTIDEIPGQSTALQFGTVFSR
jgi:prepilin-type N-terminal cleavage/methylation domain-containing protein